MELNEDSFDFLRTFIDCADPMILQAKCRELCTSLVIDMKEAHVQVHHFNALKAIQKDLRYNLIYLGKLTIYLLENQLH